jgi:hypothetical protein
LDTTPGLDNPLPTPWADSMPGRMTTKYEARAHLAGRPCHYFVRQRNDQPAPPVPVVRESAMPHLVFASPASFDEMRAAYVPFKVQEAGIYIGFSEVFQGRSGLLFEIHVSEPTIEQHTALLLTPHGRNTGQYTLAMGTLGHPRPTEGIQLAVRALGAWLISLHAEASIVAHALDSE